MNIIHAGYRLLKFVAPCCSCYARGGSNLNSFNGHSHDNLGFHYHLTMDYNSVPTFPFGPSLYYFGCGTCQQSVCGASSASSTASCSTSVLYPTTISTSSPSLTTYRPTATTYQQPVPTNPPLLIPIGSSLFHHFISNSFIYPFTERFRSYHRSTHPRPPSTDCSE